MARFRKVGVLGAGVMGSGIAAHVAGAGIPVVLLDIVPPELKPHEKSDRAARNRFAQTGRDKLASSRPPALFTPRDLPLIEVGNLDDDLDRLADCDWIVEAVKEDLAVKAALFERVEKVRGKHAVVSSNTSGLPLAKLVEKRGPDFRRHFLVTHFFNPVRYMRLLELVVGPETEPAVTEQMHRFGEDVLGKGVVFAKDTPNFVANRIGTFAVFDAIHQMLSAGLAVEEVDAILGPPLGRPKSAVFRTADLVGIDTLLHVARNCRELLVHDEQREVFAAPAFMEQMVKRGMLGDKSGGGFYKKTREGIFVIDCDTLQYRPQKKLQFESLVATRGVASPAERIRTLVGASDRAAEYAWKTLSRALDYSARRLGEIADDVVNIDRGMRWGFNWELGPFETLDALGLRETVDRMERDGAKPAPLIKEMAGRNARFYPTPATFFDLKSNLEKPVPVSPRALKLPKADPKMAVRQNDSATLWDIGDGVVCLELHSKMNSVSAETIQMLAASIEEAERNWLGLVIGNEAPEAFSAGANLTQILLAARERRWDELERISRDFQQANLRLRHASVPVVSAPFGLTLGGGAELAMSAGTMRAHAELYMGLVEVGVGVVPAAGGVKEMVFRAMANIPENVDPFLPISKAFETIALAKVSTSAEDARDLGFLGPCDRVSLARDELIGDAKQTVLGLARAGWRRPQPQTVRVPGEPGIANLQVALWSMAQASQASEHDLKVGAQLARVVCGGSVAWGSRVSEKHLLDLEREAFLSLCGEAKSQERMEHMLKTNKPLRN